MAVRVLVFSKTTGYRHESIPAGVAAVREECAAIGLAVDATEDASRLTDLGEYAAVVFLSPSGTVLDGSQRDAFEAYLRSGGGFVGIHAATTAEPDWPFYGDVVGAHFTHHPHIQPATVRVEDRDHPATAHLGAAWVRTDEWYDFASNPRDRVRVLLSVDESTYTGGGMGADHPIAWCHENFGGPAFYTALGHAVEAYHEPVFRAHLLGGIRYAVGLG